MPVSSVPGGVARKAFDDVGFPFHGAVAQVGRVQHRFLVGVVVYFWRQPVHHFGGGKGGHAFRQEGIRLVIELGADVLLRVLAHRQCRFHDDAGVAQHFVARVLLEQGV